MVEDQFTVDRIGITHNLVISVLIRLDQALFGSIFLVPVKSSGLDGG
jgi:hypothetical protein